MNIQIYPHAPAVATDRKMIDSLAEGFRKHGESVEILDKKAFDPRVIERADMVVTGIVDTSSALVNACLQKQIPFLYYDKGYTNRGWIGAVETSHRTLYFRLIFNHFHPIRYIQNVLRPSDRWESLGIVLRRFKTLQEDGPIIFAGCSQEFANLYDFDITEYASRVISQLRQYTQKKIVYRPKKAQKSPLQIPGAEFSFKQHKLNKELRRAFALVTFSSTASLNALIMGTPAINLGPAATRPIFDHDMTKIVSPSFPNEAERQRFVNALAYCQWTWDEMASGFFWEDFRQNLRTVIGRPSGTSIATSLVD